MATAASATFRPSRPASGFQWNTRSAVAPIRLLAVDEHPLVREGLAAVLNREPGMALVAQASSGGEAMDTFREYRPDVVILDLSLPDVPGEQLVKQLLAEFPDARIVVITSACGDVRMLRILEAGVQGFVLRGMPNKDLLDAIRQVHSGKKMVPRQIASAIAEHIADETLTPREIQVLQLVAQGNRNKEIAGLLSIADETVRMHMKNILSKLAANDRTHAVTIAVKRGVFQL
jgi:two-component system NarL family response regulator